ncbi:MAG: hypothetical protein WCR79_01755 [Fusobacterium sp.]
MKKETIKELLKERVEIEKEFRDYESIEVDLTDIDKANEWLKGYNEILKKMIELTTRYLGKHLNNGNEKHIK